MWIRLDELKAGDTGCVAGFDRDFGSYRQKLLAMGLTPGTEFSVIRVAPLGDPVAIRVRGTDLSLRRAEVSALRIERVDREPAIQKSEQQDEFIVAVIGNPN